MGSKDTVFSLNQDELLLLSDPSFFIKKKLVTSKIVDLLGLLETELDLICQNRRDILPEPLLLKRGKISRGENYRGLPYVVLDYPAIFGKEGVFAFRTLMWWGNSFSFTFHLSGSYLEQFLSGLRPSLHEFDGSTLVCINTLQWEHHHEPANYMPLGQFVKSPDNNNDYFNKKGFIKLSKVIPLDDHAQLIPCGKEFLEMILSKLK